MKSLIAIIFCLITFPILAQEFTQLTTGDIVNDSGWNYACCWADFTGDGYDDLFVCNNDADNGKHNFLYFNNGDGTFTKITEGDIITDSNSSYGCAAADYDNDGDIDLFVSNYNENNCLYNNSGDGTFTKIISGSIVTNNGKSTGCEWIDYDKDGWLDIFICNRDEPNFLYNNNGDGTFTRITTGLIVTENRNSGNCCWADYDDNGYPDVFIANSGPNYNSLFLNNGDGTFSQVTGDPIVSDLESFNICCTGDYDNDGDFDVFTAPGMLPASAYDLYLYQNNGDGSFVRIPNLPHAGINSGGGCAMIDYDNDGDLDIFESAYDGSSIILQNNGPGNFTQITTGVLVNSGSYNKEPSWTDFDLDGDLDVFLAVNNYFGGNNKFFSNNGNTNNWLFIDLLGEQSNANGIDALISVTANINGQDVTQTKRVSDRNSLTTHFGLGDAAIVDEIVVTWPSGEVTTLNDEDVNQYLDITEGSVILYPPNLFEAEVYGFNDVVLSWEDPGPHIEILSHHGDYTNSIIGTGASITLICAARFDEVELSEYYNNYCITKVAITLHSFNYYYLAVQVYEGGSYGDPGTLVSEAIIASNLTDQITWIITLPEPVSLVADNEYWLAYEITSEGEYPFAFDSAPMVPDKGAWIYLNGLWRLLPSLGFWLNHNWMISGYLTENEIALDGNNITEREDEVVMIDSQFQNNNLIRNSRELLGYTIYRNGNEIASISNPNTMAYLDAELNAGTYEYTIVANYDEGNSEPEGPENVEIILSAPENVNAFSDPPDIVIIWDPPSETRELLSYNVYKNGEVVTNVTTEYYIDENIIPVGSYDYNVSALFSGGFEGALSDTSTVYFVGINEISVSVEVRLENNFPNPFNPETTISFSTTECTENTEISVFNLKGQKIKTLVNEILASGNHSVVWDGTDESGKTVSSGVYLYKMKAGDYQKIRKMILMK